MPDPLGVGPDAPEAQACNTGFVLLEPTGRALDQSHAYGFFTHDCYYLKTALTLPLCASLLKRAQAPISSTVLPRLAATDSGERMFCSASNVARTTFTGLVDP